MTDSERLTQGAAELYAVYQALRLAQAAGDREAIAAFSREIDATRARIYHVLMDALRQCDGRVEIIVRKEDYNGKTERR